MALSPQQLAQINASLGVTPQAPQAPQPVAGGDMAQLFAALARSIQGQSDIAPQRLQMQSDALFGRHLGIGGAPATADNPRGYVGGNPFDKGFFKSTAAQLTPEQLADSQGGNAMNQWAFPGRYQWQAPPTMSAAEGAMQASPKPFQISPQSQQMLANYRGTGSAAPQGPRPVRRAQPVAGQPRPGRSYGFM